MSPTALACRVPTAALCRMARSCATRSSNRPHSVPCPETGGVPQDQVDDEAGPAGLVRGAEAAPGVAVEVLVERQQVVPVRVGLEQLLVAEDRPAAVFVVEEDADQPAGQVGRHCGEPDFGTRAGRVLDEEVVAVEA